MPEPLPVPRRTVLPALRRAAWACLLALPLAGPAAAAVVPVTLIDGLPVVPVRLGSVQVDFLLDTGAGTAITVPRPLIVPAAGVVELAQTTTMIDAAGKVQDVPRVRVAEASIGGVALGPLDGLVDHRWGLSIGTAAAPAVTHKGVISLHALDAHRLVFDLGHGRLTILDAAEPAPAGRWSSAPFAYDRRGVVVRMSAQGRVAELALDSAATTSLLNKRAPVLVGRNDVCKGKPQNAPLCGQTVFSRARIGDAAAAPMRFTVVAMGPLPFDGLLGIDFFRAHVVLLDFQQRVMHFRPSGAAAP